MPSMWTSSDQRASGFAAVLALLLAGCAVAKAPSDWLPNVDGIPEDAFGAWVEIKQSDTTRFGELIAVDDDSLYMLPVAPRRSTSAREVDSLAAGRPVLIPRSTVRQARLFWFDSDWERLALMSLGGTAASLSHGALLVVSWPFWILGGVASSNTRSRAPLVRYPESPWSDLNAYARFPQGMPRDVDQLRPRPRAAD